MSLPFQLPYLILQLINSLWVFADQWILFALHITQHLTLVKNKSIQTLNLHSVFFVLILLRIQLVFKILNPSLWFLTTIGKLRFKLDLGPPDLRLLVRLRLVDLSNKLLLLQRDPLPFKFDDLEFFSVLTTQLEVLLFWMLKSFRLLLKLFIDRHYLLEILLHPIQILDQLPVCLPQLCVLIPDVDTSNL